MVRKYEKPFQAELHRAIKNYLEKYGGVKGVELEVEDLGAFRLDRKEPDIVIKDKRKAPVLIIETKRKGDRPSDRIDPWDPTPIAQALCYAILTKERYGVLVPLIATANEDLLVLFDISELLKLEDKDLRAIFDVYSCAICKEKYEDMLKTSISILKSRKLVRELSTIENPIKNVEKILEYVADVISLDRIVDESKFRITIFLEELHRLAKEFSKNYVKDAVKNAFISDRDYFIKLLNGALDAGYKYGISILKLIPECRNSVVCDYIRDKIIHRYLSKLKEKTSKSDREKIFGEFFDNGIKILKEKKVKDIIEELRIEKDPLYKEKFLNRPLIDLFVFENLADMMTYVLINKVVFYKILEYHYPYLPKLKPIEWNREIEIDGYKIKVDSLDRYIEAINLYFQLARKKIEERVKIQDFEPIFVTGPFDLIKLKDRDAVDEFNEIIKFIDKNKETIVEFPGIIGYVYERFIPPSERHVFGEFYTPPAVCRLIAKFAIRSGSDKILDAGCGSGTFLIEAYKRFLRIKFGKNYGDEYPSEKEHPEILNNINGLDINPFATHLTSMYLILMQPKYPVSQLNIKTCDYFKFIDQKFDAVIGNPPYTRWVEIPDGTQNLILDELDKDIGFRKYNLKPAIARGREPGIYVYWIIHSSKLLEDGGRLAMIISNAWLQTEYGIDFGRFLIDNFKIKALIDISFRLFEALISTVIILAEKEKDKRARDDNIVTLIRIPPRIKGRELSGDEIHGVLDEVLKCIEDAINDKGDIVVDQLERCKKEYGIKYKQIKQSEMPTDEKWISLFFDVEDIINELERSPLTIKVKEWFIPSRGNSIWCIYAIKHGKRPDLGAKDFFYFNKSKATDKSIPEDFLVPAITRSQYIKTFTFTKNDWKSLKDEDKDVYIFICHAKREILPQEVQEYIKWGETDCRTRIRGSRGGGRICSEAEACKARRNPKVRKFFYDWYDLGGYIPTPLMAIRQARYRSQFFLCEFPATTYDAIITLIPKVEIKTKSLKFNPTEYERIFKELGEAIKSITLDEDEIKALLAYLNSTFVWLWLERNARYIPKGPLGLEVSIVEELPILNIKAIDRKYVIELSKMFDELEFRARTLISRKEKKIDDEGPKLKMFRDLRPIFRKIDEKIAEILGISTDVDELWNYAWEMMERRVKGAERVVKPGAEVIEVVRDKKQKSNNIAKLSEFFEI